MACLLQSEGFCVQPAHEELVEVAYYCRQQQENGVLCHEGLRQPCPAEASSEIALSIVSELHVRSVGCSERWGIRWLVTSSTQSPPQK